MAKLHATSLFEGVFTDNNKILNQMLATCHESTLTVLGYTKHAFYPQGFTAVILLAESHLSIHTYPEDNCAYVDLFMCNSENEMQVRAIIKDLAMKLGCVATRLEINQR